MSSVTSLTPLPYPDPTDQPFVHLDLKALAEATTESLFVAAETAPAHKVGRRWVKPSTKREYVSDGAEWWQIGGPPNEIAFTYNANYGAPTAASNGVPNPLRLFKINRTCYAVGAFRNVNALASVGTNIQEVFATLPTAAKPSMDAAITGSGRRLNFPALGTLAGTGFNMATFIVADDDNTLRFQPGRDLTSIGAQAFSLSVGLLQWETTSLPTP